MRSRMYDASSLALSSTSQPSPVRVSLRLAIISCTVPISAFKDATLSCHPPDDCERVFTTSGTTRGDITTAVVDQV